MTYHVLMEKKASLTRALTDSGFANSYLSNDASLIIETEYPEACQAIANDFNYQLIFADPKDYSKQLIIDSMRF